MRKGIGRVIACITGVTLFAIMCISVFFPWRSREIEELAEGNTYAESDEPKQAEQPIKSQTSIGGGISVSASWTGPSYREVSALGDDSDLIIVGKVFSSLEEDRKGLTFTRHVIEIKKVYKGEVKIGDTVELVQTGGRSADGFSNAPAEVPLLDSEKEYLLFLYETEPNEIYGQYYLITGGFRGVAEIKDDKCIAVSSENSSMVNQFERYLKELDM